LRFAMANSTYRVSANNSYEFAVWTQNVDWTYLVWRKIYKGAWGFRYWESVYDVLFPAS
jgi:hypothetical protein